MGSANLDVVAHTARIPNPGETVLGNALDEFPGGKGLNQAVAAARSGATTRFVGALGDDPAGARLRAVFDGDGIDGDITPSDRPTGRAIITVDDGAENTIVVIAGANADVPAPDVGDTAVVLAQLEIPIDVVTATFRRARANGTTTILNPAPAAELPPDLLAATDYLVPNEHEVDRIGGAEHALTAGCTAVIVTMGAAGVDVVTGDGSTHVPPFAVTPIDTTGAGDAFCGSFAARIAVGDDVGSAARWAAAAGALATTVRGAVPGQPHADRIRSLLADG